MSRIQKILSIVALALIAVASPYLIAKYQAFTYARGQVIVPGVNTATPSPQPQNQSQTVTTSPDGKDSLTENISKKDGLVTYTFTTDKGLYYSKTVSTSDSITVPFNAWSSDNSLIFLKETIGGVDNFIVMSASGKQILGQAAVNVTDAFAKKLPDYKWGDATGWASQTLLIINANKSDGSQGPSFWYDLTDGSFIQLSNRFN